MNTKDILEIFQTKITKNGFPENIVWVDTDKMYYAGDTFKQAYTYQGKAQ